MALCVNTIKQQSRTDVALIPRPHLEDLLLEAVDAKWSLGEVQAHPTFASAVHQVGL